MTRVSNKRYFLTPAQRAEVIKKNRTKENPRELGDGKKKDKLMRKRREKSTPNHDLQESYKRK